MKTTITLNPETVANKNIVLGEHIIARTLDLKPIADTEIAEDLLAYNEHPEQVVPHGMDSCCGRIGDRVFFLLSNVPLSRIRPEFALMKLEEAIKEAV